MFANIPFKCIYSGTLVHDLNRLHDFGEDDHSHAHHPERTNRSKICPVSLGWRIELFLHRNVCESSYYCDHCRFNAYIPYFSCILKNIFMPFLYINQIAVLWYFAVLLRVYLFPLTGWYLTRPRDF